MQSRVSFIVPVYNVEAYLSQCVQSIFMQTMKEIEVICVNDGSTDRSGEMLDELARSDQRVKIIHQNNQGLAQARNVALKIASGEYVQFVDADDYIAPSMLEKTCFEADKTNADIVLFANSNLDNQTGKITPAPWSLRVKLIPTKAFSRKDCSDTLMMVTQPVCWTKLFRRSFLLGQGLEFQEISYAEDVFFTMMSLALADRISYVNEALYLYRSKHPGSLTSFADSRQLEVFCAYEKLYDELNKRGLFVELEYTFVQYVLNSVNWYLNGARNRDNKVLRQLFCRELREERFTRMGILDHPFDYYADRKAYEAVKSTLAQM